MEGVQEELNNFWSSSDIKAGPIPYQYMNSGFPSLFRGDKFSGQTIMMGRFTMNFYKLGDKVLVLALDSKSRKSAMGHTFLTPNYSRSKGMPYPAPYIEFYRTPEMTTTYQTYMFMMSPSQ